MGRSRDGDEPRLNQLDSRDRRAQDCLGLLAKNLGALATKSPTLTQSVALNQVLTEKLPSVPRKPPRAGVVRHRQFDLGWMNGRPRCCGPLTRGHCAAMCCKDRWAHPALRSTLQQAGRRPVGGLRARARLARICLESAASSMCLEESWRWTRSPTC